MFRITRIRRFVPPAVNPKANFSILLTPKVLIIYFVCYSMCLEHVVRTQVRSSPGSFNSWCEVARIVALNGVNVPKIIGLNTRN